MKSLVTCTFIKFRIYHKVLTYYFENLRFFVSFYIFNFGQARGLLPSSGAKTTEELGPGAGPKELTSQSPITTSRNASLQV